MSRLTKVKAVPSVSKREVTSAIAERKFSVLGRGRGVDSVEERLYSCWIFSKEDAICSKLKPILEGIWCGGMVREIGNEGDRLGVQGGGWGCISISIQH